MGVDLSQLLAPHAREIELVELSGEKIAVDAFNMLYQFISIIRDRFTGEPLRDSKGRITSHLSGLLYRTSNLIEAGIKPVFVFDGEPPRFKQAVVEQRREAREEAGRRWEEAVAKGEPAMKYAQAAGRLTAEMVESAKQLLDCMGVPWIQAPSEGEAMCAHLCKKNLVHAAASQDADALLFGSPRLVRNLSITGKRKLPKKETYVDIKPELIDLGQVLGGLGITQKQLVVLGMLVGTDYAPGVKGIGAKTALKVVKEQKTLEAAIAEVGWDADVPAAEIYEFFLHPPVEDKLADKFAEKLAGRREHEKHEHEMEWRGIDSGKLRDFMVAEHDFSAERVDKVIERLEKAQSAGAQSSLKGWLQK